MTTQRKAGGHSNATTVEKKTCPAEFRKPVPAVLPINHRFRLSADERCWRIEQRRKDGEWRPIEYHTTLAAAIKSLSGRLLRTSEVHCLARCLSCDKEHRTHAYAGACTTFLRSAANRVIQHIRRGGA
jgi:hypothetical protein